MPRTRPWLRLDAQYDRDAKVRKSRAAAIWPAVLCRLKPGGGRCSADDLDPEMLAADLHLPVELVEPMVEGLFRVGLLQLDGDEVLTPGWAKYQEVDTRPHSRSRKPADSAYSQNVPPSPKGPKCPKDRTGQDRTETRKTVVVDSEVARAHEAGDGWHPAERRSWSEFGAVVGAGSVCLKAKDPSVLTPVMEALRGTSSEPRRADLEEWTLVDDLVDLFGPNNCLRYIEDLMRPGESDRPAAHLRAILENNATPIKGDAWKLKWQQ